jgi:4-alpha-glucanotransferase
MRRSGILLHPTSLPGRHGIGDLGKPAFSFADFLAAAGQSLWQVLPLGPPVYGNSPYQCSSSMAGNPLLIDLEELAQQGLLSLEDLQELPTFPADRVDFEAVSQHKWRFLRKAARAFFQMQSGQLRIRYEQFCAEQRWLDKFAEFSALKELNGGVAWTEWRQLSPPDPEDVDTHKFIQFEFFRQWAVLKNYCNGKGIKLIGDIPIFVAHDSADVWSHPHLFDLDERGKPSSIAGVPPDYFSATGQCWGNPLYRWDVMEQTGFEWWISRIRSLLDQVDLIRLDHFRGFEKYYAIPGDARTAVHGEWLNGPGDRFFGALKNALGNLPFIAEDLGLITAEVHALRDRWNLPGMRVLQFAFGGDDPGNPFKPYNFIRNCVAYTGTHDNDTIEGWLSNLGGGDSTRTAEQCRMERRNALKYLGCQGKDLHWGFMRLISASVADMAIFPLQDVLGLGSEARMNRPATAENNWRWRVMENQLTPEVAAALRTMTVTYGRI